MPVSVLCVQRDRELGRHYAEALTSEGYEVIRAQDGRGALEILRKQLPGLVVLDVMLARQDGFEILAELRMRPETESLPVLLLFKGGLTEEIKLRAKKLGALGIESAPIATERLIARVAYHLGTSDDKQADADRRVPRQGCLREIPFPELLHRLQRDGLDGVLLLDHGRKKKAIELRSGWPVSVKSNLVSECLGSYLIAQGRCTQAQLDESVNRMRKGEGLQGEILVAMDVLDEPDVVDALRAHAMEKFFEIFSWRDGQFKIREGMHVQRGSSFGIDGHPSGLIVEGIRRHFPLKQIDRYLAINQDAFLVPLESRQEQLASVQLTAEEASWLEGVDGSMSFGALLEAPESIRRVAFGLISIEVLGVESEGRSEAGARPSLEEFSRNAVDETASAKTEVILRGELAALANDIQNKDHYGVLGVTRTTDDDEIRSAYTRLAKQTHPDRFHAASSSVRQLAGQVFDRIAQAHAAIATAAGRESYAQEISRGRRAAAIEDEGRRALQAETEFQRGERLSAARDYEGALLCYGRAMENYPSEGEYRSHYGWCLYLCHPDNEVMLGEALEHCREGVKLAKDREKPYLLLGRLYKAMGRATAAKKMFTRAVEIKPQCVEAMRELRIMNMRREKDKGVLKRIFRR